MAVVGNTTRAQIRFSTQIIKRLGEELNPSIDQSILELVKNAYDADASNCTVELKDITEEGGSISISDDGIGMNSSDIINGWLVLGESSKSHRKMTSLGRIPAGSKGLGRLAALRMGHVAELKTVPKSDLYSKYELKIDWDKFDKAKLVDDVDLLVDKYVRPVKSAQGTTISIKKLKQKVGIREVKRIARGLILLADPFDDDPNAFKPVLKAQEFKDMERLVSQRYFEEAEYHLVANINSRGRAEASVLDYKGNLLFKADHGTVVGKNKRDAYNCPPVTFDLWAFILNSTTFSTRQVALGEVQDWLREFGGVHLYENGLRVNPYGNPGNDWLDMNLARSRSPEERPSTNTSIGVVRVKDSKGLLSQKTDRSGFIENDVFHEIRSFCQDVLEWMAKRRLEIAEIKRRTNRRNTADDAKATKDEVERAISNLSANRKTEIQKLFTKYDRARQNEVKILKSEVQLYRTLSTAGITAATFSHESRGNPLKVIKNSIRTIERRIKQSITKKYDELFAKPVKGIYNSIESLKVLGNATLELLAHEKRRVSKVELHNVLSKILETFEPFLEGRDISVIYEPADCNPYLRSTPAAIESILTNLLNNSIVALECSTSNREIKVKTIVEENVFTLSVADNGPGIKNISLKDIWLPGQTTNPNGTGLGLTIVRDSVYDLGGKVRAVAESELGGAEIIVELPIIGM